MKMKIGVDFVADLKIGDIRADFYNPKKPPLKEVFGQINFCLFGSLFIDFCMIY